MATSQPDSNPNSIKFIAGSDPFGAPLKDQIVTHLRSLNYAVDDLGVSPYFSAGDLIGRRVAAAGENTYGVAVCGTGVGVGMFANKVPGVYAATCLSVDDARNARSISNANVIALSGKYTSPEKAGEMIDAFVRTPFKAPCPANDNQEWDPEVQSFLDNSLAEMAKIGKEGHESQPQNPKREETLVECAICCLAKNREFVPVDIMPGGMMKIVRETPTSAIVQFKAGSVEPAHHHTFGHCLVVTKGSKCVWNLTKGEKCDLTVGDYLFTPAGDVHRVKYFEDTEFFIKWDGHWDIFLDEDLETAKAAIEKDLLK